jgi:hypothetical protein
MERFQQAIIFALSGAYYLFRRAGAELAQGVGWEEGGE